VGIHVYAILAIGWFAWSLPFLLAKRNAEPAKEVDRRARWADSGNGLSPVGESLPAHSSWLWQLCFPGPAPAPSAASGGSMPASVRIMSS